MRDFLNAILAGIGTSSLTDEEFAFDEIQALSHQDFRIENYTALLLVLDTREVVSSMRDRLRYGFMAHGTEVAESSPAKSEIYLGSGLCN